MTYVVSTSRLSKNLSGNNILSDMNLHIKKGEIYGLLGLNGAGKTSVMKQRLGLARAISTRPELLLLDEPINGLDPVGLKNMRNLISALSKEYGMTVFLTSHLLRELELIANTIGVIREGKLIREVAMENIQRDWTEYIELVTKDVVKAVSILSNKLEMCNFKLINESTIRIYDLSLPQPEIVRTLILNGVDIGEIRRKNQTLEDYFLNLLQGSGDT
ncbi:MAG: ATP-binding cassette domain-containing protein [Bacillota bacterium]